MTRTASLLIALAATAALLPAQLRITGLDGLASKAKESVDITFDENMIRNFMPKGKDQTKALEGLKTLVVKSFEFDRAGEYKLEDLDPIRAQLQGPGWSRLMRVAEKDELVEMYARSDQSGQTGFALIAAEARELTVIAIEGSVSLNDLAAIGDQFGIEGMPGAKQKQKQKQEKQDKNKKGKDTKE